MIATKQITLPFSDTVKVGNALVRSPMRFKSHIAFQILAYVSSCISPSDKDFKDYTFPAKGILEDNFGGTDYLQIKKACAELSSYSIDLSRARQEQKFAFVSLFSFIGYSDGFITARFDPALKEFYIELKEHFTLYDRPKFFMLRSTYAQQLFRVLHSYRNLPYIIISLEDLHYYLHSAVSFQKQFKEFRRAAFEPACNEILNTGFVFTWEAVKAGRKVTAIKFIFSNEKEQASIQIPQKKSLDIGSSAKWDILKEEYRVKGLSLTKKQTIMFQALVFMGFNETILMEMIEMFSRNAKPQMDFFNFIEILIERYANCKEKGVERNGYIYASFKSEFVAK